MPPPFRPALSCVAWGSACVRADTCMFEAILTLSRGPPSSRYLEDLEFLPKQLSWQMLFLFI